MISIELNESEVETIGIAFGLFRQSISQAWMNPSFNISMLKAYVDSMRDVESKIEKAKKSGIQNDK